MVLQIRNPAGKRSMQNDQTTQDAKRLLVAMSSNHPEARTASPYGLDRAFSPSWADAEQAGLDRSAATPRCGG
jgi:hypothetical protein